MQLFMCVQRHYAILKTSRANGDRDLPGLMRAPDDHEGPAMPGLPRRTGIALRVLHIGIADAGHGTRAIDVKNKPVSRIGIYGTVFIDQFDFDKRQILSVRDQVRTVRGQLDR